MKQKKLDNATAPRSVDQQQACSDWPRCLSVRASNALANHYRRKVEYENGGWDYLIPPADEVKADIQARKIIPGGPRNYGEKSHAEVCRCLGIAVTRKSAWKFDPFTGKPLV